MADPATLAAIGIGSTAVSTGFKLFGEEQAGEAAQQKARYQQAVALMNAQIEEQNKNYALAKGGVQAQQVGMKWAADIANFRAGRGASGLDVNVGSPTDVVKSMGDLSKLDQATIRSNAAWAAYGHDVRRGQELAEAGMYGAAAQNARTASLLSMGGTAAEGVGSVADKWYKYKANFPGDNPRDVGSATSLGES